MRKTRFLTAIGAIAMTLAVGASSAQAISSSPTYRGGPVLSGYDTQEVIWSHAGKTAASAVTEGLAGFLGDVAAGSGTTEDVFAMLPQYSTQGLTGGDQIAAYRSTYLGSAEVAPAGGASVTMAAVETALNEEIAGNKLPTPALDANGVAEILYTVVLPPNMELCEQSTCSGPKNGGSQFCSLRGSAHYNSTPYTLVVMLDLSEVLGSGCGGSPPTQLQKETSILTQQLGETITDPFILEEKFGWMNSEGLGVGYICNGENATDTINGHTWTVQKLWSNADNACVGTDGLFHPPTGNFTATPTENKATFAGSGSSNNHLASVAKGISSYSWDFGDGQSGTGQNPTHEYAAGGTYTVNMTATDTLGFTTHATHQVTVSAPPSSGGTGGSGGTTGGSGGTTGGSGGTTGGSGGSTGSSGGTGNPSGNSGGAGGTAAVSMTGAPSTSGKGSSVVVNSGETAQCPPAGGLCVVTVTGEVESAHLGKKAKPKNHKVQVGKATITLTPGTSAKLTFQLNGTGKKLLSAHGHLLVKVVVTIRHGSDAAVLSTRTITIAAAKKKHGKR